MKVYVKSIIVMVCLCLVMGLLLALVYSITHPIIEENEARAKQEALEEMFPGKSFSEITLTDDASSCVTSVYVADGDHYAVVNLSISTGYTNGETTLIMGVDTATMTITELKFLSYNESVDCTDAFPASFAGQTAALTDVVTSASPAVYTRAAVKTAVQQALQFVGDTVA